MHRALLSLPAETAHDVAVAALNLAEKSVVGRVFLPHGSASSCPRLRQSLLGLEFPNPIGLAAGFDKDGEVVAAMARMGFGWLEVGTVTPRPQPGNPRPRLFRHRRAASLENRMGFNNAGGEALRDRLARCYPARVPLGVNLGKNKDTPNDEAVSDYSWLLRTLNGSCDYFVINVSSPNTPGLRDLQQADFLAAVLSEARSLTSAPVFVKFSPDVDTARAVALAVSVVDSGAAGIILTNTTNRYELVPTAHGVGGLSGACLREKSFAMLDAVAEEVFGRCVLVSVGGIDSGQEVYRRVRAGASLVQIYTALVYQGPALIGRLCLEVERLLERDGLDSVDQAVGADRR